MRVEPVARITGAVTSSNRVDVPERTDQETGERYAAYSYVEVSVEVPGAIQQTIVEGVTVPVLITDAVGGALATTPPGTFVDLYAYSYSTWQRHRGRAFKVTRYRYCGPVPAALSTPTKAA